MSFTPKIYGYWRSSASWRIRWAFELKQAAFEYVPVNILQGHNHGPAHRARNPLGALPVLEVNAGVYLSESLAMMEWLEEVHPAGHKLYPGSALHRAQVRALCEIINSETGPLQTLRTQKKHSEDPAAQKAWAVHFIREGLRAYETLSAPLRGQFSVGDEVSAADLCLIPQLYNALRYPSMDARAEFPQLFAIYDRALATEACRKAAPEAQIDALKEAPKS